MASRAPQQLRPGGAADYDDEPVVQLRRQVRSLQRQLDEAQKRADHLEQLQEAKARFLNVASHDLRGPLTVLMGHLSLLEEGVFGEVPEGFSRVLPDLSARLADMQVLIDAMLDTARLDDGPLHLLRAPLDLCDVVGDAMQRCQVFAKDGQELRLRLPAAPVVVDGDHARLLTAVLSLLHNAVKFSPPGASVRATVTSRNGEARVVVSDRGPGIAQQDHDAIFERFCSVQPGAARAAAGAGLGLYLAREIARAHGGDIGVVSEPGSGSTFTLTLPLP